MAEPTICVLTDFSDTCRAAYPVAESLARRTGTRLQLVHVLQPTTPIPAAGPLASAVVHPSIDVQADIEHAHASMEKERLHFANGSELATTVIVGDKLDEAIADHEASERPEFVVLASHGRSGVRRLLMGSVAESILRNSKTPLVVVPVE